MADKPTKLDYWIEGTEEGKTLLHFDFTPQPFPLKPEQLPELEALPKELEAYRLYTVEQLSRFPPVTFLIGDWLATAELTCLYGKGDTYKSFMALGWSCQLAEAGHKVVYIAAEGASGLRARVAAWMKHHDVSELEGLRIMAGNVPIHRPGYVAHWLEAMELQLKSEKPSLVVVDTLARNFVGGSENDAKDMGEFIEGLERIRRDLETAVLVLHHTDKKGEKERGTESLRNATFAMLKAQRSGGQGATAKLMCDRIKDAAPPDDVTVKLVPVDLPDLGSDHKGEPIGSLAMEPFADAIERREKRTK